MTTEVKKAPSAGISTDPARKQEGRQILALDTLSKLARQFSNHPDFGQLNELMVLTISGQFSVPNTCALIRQPGTQSTVPLLYGTGKLRNDRLLLSQELTDEHCEYFLLNRSPANAIELTEHDSTANLGYVLSECGVKLVAPLVHNDNVIGILCLGERVTKKPFTDSDHELLATLVNTITPFLASSFLFLEIAGLNKWYLAILDSVGQGVFVFNSQGQLKKVNNTGFNILKSFKPHLVHMCAILKAPMELVFDNTIFRDWTKRFKGALKDPRTRLLENMVATSEDIKRIYNVHISRMDSQSVLESDLIITIDDITDQKQSEHQIFELQKLADMGVMASSISHELNNFLGLILGGVEMTEIALKKDDMEKVGINLGKLKNSVAKMERFTNGLMDYAKLETQKKPGSLNNVIAEVMTYVTAQKKFNRIRVLSELDPKLPEVDLDAGQISQLLLNLLNNAADAIYEARRDVGEIVVRTFTEHALAVLSVSDNGTGIKPEVSSKLFKQGFTTKEKGHGHGLVTCGKIIRNHDAEVLVDSKPGSGTTFVFRFPLEIHS
ncbi:MAG: GAF domain-containing protein [Candidatus Zixiibacteriota bacterium]|nr:MAG: GAF domain-containing protein [candidate division Zixibacteria bacterium]